MADRKNQSKPGSIGALVRALCGGRFDKSVADTITRHAKERAKDSDEKETRKKLKGLDSIPQEFLKKSYSGGDRKQRFRFEASPKALVFFQNLLDLDSALGPQLASDVLRRKHLALEVGDLRSRVATARREASIKFDAYGAWLGQWQKLEKRLFEDRFDPTKEPLALRSPRGAGGQVLAETAALTVPFQTLHVAKQLEDIDRRVGRDLDGPSASATKALLLLQIGEQKLAASMIEDAIANTPQHFLANYAFAMLYLARAGTAAKEANYRHFVATELDSEREHYHQPDVDAAVGRYIDLREQAFRRLAVALDHWPSSTYGTSTTWHDHQKRGQVLAILFQLAFERSHDHGNVDMDMLHGLGARRAGDTLKRYFRAEGLDETVLAAAKEVERYSPMELRASSLQIKTMLLQIYFVVSPEEYARFLPVWCQELRKSPPWAVRQLVTPGWQGREPYANIVREHLRRATSNNAAAIGAICSDLEGTAQTELRGFFAEVQEFMTKDPNQREDDDDFDSWE